MNNKNIQVSFEGMLGQMLEHSEKKQLLDTELWKKFVHEFRLLSDSADNGWRGEFWGKTMRAGALVCRCTRNEELSDILHDAVRDILTVQDDLGRISCYTVEKEFNGWDIWGRKYVLLGMCYFLDICKSDELREKVIASMCAQVDYLISKIGNEEGKICIHKTSKWYGASNSSSILEAVVRLYKLTDEQKYLDFAKYIVDQGGCAYGNIFEMAYDDKILPYQYPATKAYETMSCFEGLVEYYEVTGDEKCRRSAENFARRLIESEVTVVGGMGCSMECFDHSALRQASGSVERLMQETCVTVTWMKLCYRIFMITGDSIFADYFERSLYNAYASAFNTEDVTNDAGFPAYSVKDGGEIISTCLPYDSYANMRKGHRGLAVGGAKLLSDRTYYGCCACIASAGIGVAPLLAAVNTDGGIKISLYSKGKISAKTPSGQDIELTVDTEYPFDGVVNMTVALENAEELTLYVRVPYWSKTTEIAVNGEKIAAVNGYTAIKRLWKCGDKLSLVFDMEVVAIPAPTYETDELNAEIDWNTGANFKTTDIATEDTPYHVAFRRGPIVFARDARLGESWDAVDVDAENLQASVCDTDVKANLALCIKQKDGTSFKVIDCASAGKTWSEESEYEVWLPTVRK